MTDVTDWDPPAAQPIVREEPTEEGGDAGYAITLTATCADIKEAARVSRLCSQLAAFVVEDSDTTISVSHIRL